MLDSESGIKSQVNFYISFFFSLSFFSFFSFFLILFSLFLYFFLFLSPLSHNNRVKQYIVCGKFELLMTCTKQHYGSYLFQCLSLNPAAQKPVPVFYDLKMLIFFQVLIPA